MLRSAAAAEHDSGQERLHATYGKHILACCYLSSWMTLILFDDERLTGGSSFVHSKEVWSHDSRTARSPLSFHTCLRCAWRECFAIFNTFLWGDKRYSAFVVCGLHFDIAWRFNMTAHTPAAREAVTTRHVNILWRKFTVCWHNRTNGESRDEFTTFDDFGCWVPQGFLIVVFGRDGITFSHTRRGGHIWWKVCNYVRHIQGPSRLQYPQSQQARGWLISQSKENRSSMNNSVGFGMEATSRWGTWADMSCGVYIRTTVLWNS